MNKATIDTNGNTGEGMPKTGILGWDPAARYGIPPAVVTYTAFFVGLVAGVAAGWLPDPAGAELIANVLLAFLTVALVLGIFEVLAAWFRSRTAPPVARVVDDAANVVRDFERDQR